MECCVWTRPGRGWGAGERSDGGLRLPARVCRGELRAGELCWRRGRRPAGVRCGAESGKEKSAVIVGAGPAGALLALLLARQDWKVDVFERKEWRDGSWAPGQPEGWNVMLGERAACCLEALGLKEDVWAEDVSCTGRTAVTGSGLKPRYQPYGYELLAIPQPKLASVLINSGMRNYPGKISYQFGWALYSLDPEDAIAEFCPADESQGANAQSEIVVTADLVVGADGLHPRTRGELETKTGSFRSTLHSVPAGRHMRLRVPVDVVGEQVDEVGNTHGPSMLVVSRRAKLMWGVPNRGGTMGLTLQGIRGSTPADVSSEMQEAFPELAGFFNADGEASASLAAAPERVQGTVTATSYNYKQIAWHLGIV